jgi:hypothetical protein
MKTRYLYQTLTFIVLVLVTIMSSAQTQSIEGEIILRPALTSLRGNDVIEENLDPAFNMSFGMGVNFLLTEKKLINVALLYEKKGGRDEHTVMLRDETNAPIGTAKGKFESNFQYVSIPVQYGFRFGKTINYEAAIGVYAALLLKQESKTEFAQFVDERDETDLYKSFDFGASVSFSAYVPVGESLHLKLGVTDNLGVVNVSDVPVADDGTIKHNSLALVAGINYRLR